MGETTIKVKIIFNLNILLNQFCFKLSLFASLNVYRWTPLFYAAASGVCIQLVLFVKYMLTDLFFIAYS